MDTKTNEKSKLKTYKIWRQGSGVRRFHTAPLIGEQTVGQHSWGVASLVNLLWPDCDKRVILAALSHDIAEALTGDIPAPMKWESEVLTNILNEIEEKYERIWGLHHPLSKEETLMLKAADMLELVFFSTEQQDLGNKSFQVIMQRGMEYLDKLFDDNKEHWKLLNPALELLMELTLGEMANGNILLNGVGSDSKKPRGSLENSSTELRG